MNHNGPSIPEVRQVLAERENAAKAKLADLVKVRPNELAWTPNTSQGMHGVLRGIRWQPDDEFIVSSAEHFSTRGACQALEKHYGVIIKTIPADQGDDALLTGLSSALTDRTRLVCLSQVSCFDGRRLPIAEATPIAHQWDVPVLVDGAQSVGQYAVDVGALGCDFFIASCHKWLLGTKGLGFLWIPAERIANFRPNFVPDEDLKPGNPRPPINAASKVERGTHQPAIRIGMNRTLEIINALGIDRIEAHTRRLAEMVFEEVGEWPGVKIVTPTASGRASGLLALTFDGYDEPKLQELVVKLRKAQIVVKFQPILTGMRISLAAFNNADEVHHLLETMKRFIF